MLRLTVSNCYIDDRLPLCRCKLLECRCFTVICVGGTDVRNAFVGKVVNLKLFLNLDGDKDNPAFDGGTTATNSSNMYAFFGQ